MKTLIKTIGNKVTYRLCYMSDLQSGSLFLGIFILIIVLGVL